MAARTLIWHVGLAAPARDVIGASVEAHRDELAERGAQVAATAEQTFLATRELVGDHKLHGLRGKQVSGQSAMISKRVWARKGTSILSMPDVCAAPRDQLRLPMDALSGAEIHIVIDVPSVAEQVYGAWVQELELGATVGFAKYAARVLSAESEHAQAERFRRGHDLVGILERWASGVRPERVHLLLGRTPEQLWTDVLEIADIDGVGLPAVDPGVIDPRAASLLREVNRAADDPIDITDRLGMLEPRLPEGRLPAFDTDRVAPLVDTWASRASEYDVRGDWSAVRAIPADPIELTSDAGSGVAIDRLAEALVDNARLREDNVALREELETVDRKRRRLKRKLKKVS